MDDPDDRRRAPRVPLLGRGVVYPVEDGIGHSAVVRVRDISLIGVGLIHRERLAPGDEFVLQLPRRCAADVTILCTVARCVPAEMGRGFVVGAEFVCVLEGGAGTCPADALDGRPAEAAACLAL